MKIGSRKVGGDAPVFIVAELSANHNHQKDLAIRTIKAAKAAGADAIKLQTYTPDTLTIDCDNEYFQINQGSLWDGMTLHKLYQEAYTPWEWHKELFEVAANENLICFSSPFDKTAVDFLEKLNTPAYKIASFEIQDIDLIAYTAAKGKPIIISTGIAEAADIKLALETCYSTGNDQVILLKCTSSYPAPIELANLNTMADMRTKFKVDVGLSDHTVEDIVPITATALGAKLIEKHFILNRGLGGPDAEFSLEPEDFRRMVNQVRMAELSIGTVTYEVPDKVRANRKFARSLFVVNDIKEGEIFTSENIRSIRPGFGLHPKYLKDVLGKKAKTELLRGTPLKFEYIMQKEQ